MSPINVQDLRNIAFCGNGNAGKTMLADTLLTSTGTIKRPANVDDGTSVCDFDDEEKHHKHTIESSLVHFRHAGKHFNLLDTPGYPDFVGQALGALHGVDTAVIVINAHDGIGVNTRRMFQEAGKLGLGRILVISKIDADNVEFPRLVERIQDFFGHACLPFNLPVGHGADFKAVVSTLKVPADVHGVLMDPQAAGNALIEAIIEVDEKMTERYFEGHLPTDEEISRLLLDAVAGAR